MKKDQIKEIYEFLKEQFTATKHNIKMIIKWMVFSIVIGCTVGVINGTFSKALTLANDTRHQYPWIRFGLPLAGLVIVFLYHFFKNTDDTGTNMVIESIHSSTDIPLRMAPLIFITTIITHLFGGSAGREGAAIQLGGSIANQFGKVLKLDKNDQHIIIMCGMSAGFSALFGTPLASAVFAMEVISVGIMHYSALVPCATASLIAKMIAEKMQISPESFVVGAVPKMTPILLAKMILFAALVGAVAGLFCIILHTSERVYKFCFSNPYIRIFTAGILIVLLTALLGTNRYLGSGMELIEGAFHEHSEKFYDFFLKMIFTGLTLGAGFKGGEIVPSFCIGATFGGAVAALFGLPHELMVACGMVGVFCGVTNCPITAILLAFELFGFRGVKYYMITIAVSYMLSGYHGLYKSQKIMYSKTATKFINHFAD